MENSESQLRKHAFNQKDYEHSNLYKLLSKQYSKKAVKLFFMKK